MLLLPRAGGHLVWIARVYVSCVARGFGVACCVCLSPTAHARIPLKVVCGALMFVFMDNRVDPVAMLFSCRHPWFGLAPHMALFAATHGPACRHPWPGLPAPMAAASHGPDCRHPWSGLPPPMARLAATRGPAVEAVHMRAYGSVGSWIHIALQLAAIRNRIRE